MSDNVSLQWHDGVAVFTVSSVDEDVIDEWVHAVEEVFMAWDPNKPILTVHDFSQIKVHRITRHLREQTRSVSKLREEMSTRTAIIMPATITHVMTMMNILLRTLYHSSSDNRHRKLFSDVESAVEWARNVEDIEMAE